MPGPSEARRFDIRQTPAVWFVALTLPMQHTRSPSLRHEEQSCPLRCSPPGKRASREGSGKDLEVSGLNIWPFVRSKAADPGAPAPPPPPRLPGASASRRAAARTPTPRLRRAPGPPRGRSDPGLPRRALPCRRRRRCRYRCAESARSPPAGSGETDRSRGSWRAPGAPRLPPGQGRGGAQGATRRVGAAAGPLLPRRSQSPGSTLRPPLPSRRRRRRRPG